MRETKPVDLWNSPSGRAVRNRCWKRDIANSRSSNVQDRLRARCHICKQPIDYSLRPSSTPDAWEPDHVIPRSKRPDLALAMWNIAPSHRSCNRARQDRVVDSDLGEPSREW